MSDFEVGDKIRFKSSVEELQGPCERVIDYVGKQYVIYTMTRGDDVEREFSYSLADIHLRFELVPETFEAGKRYQKTSIHSSELDIEVMWADEVVAFGRYCGTGKHTRHALLYPAERHLYKEV